MTPTRPTRPLPGSVLPATGPHPATAPRVLIIEDDAVLAGLLVEIITTAGYAVDHVGDGATGLEWGTSRTYDVLVVDRDLDGLDGLAVVRGLRRQGIEVPVLLLSAFGRTRDHLDGYATGADDYLSMPFDIDDLLTRVGTLLRGATG